MSTLQITFKQTAAVGNYLGVACRVWEGTVITAGEIIDHPGVTASLGEKYVLLVPVIQKAEQIAVLPNGLLMTSQPSPGGSAQTLFGQQIREYFGDQLRRMMEPKPN